MGNLFSPTHVLVILLICLILFGRGKISEFMGDFAKGIKSFKKGLSEEDEPAPGGHSRLDNNEHNGRAPGTGAKAPKSAESEPR